MPTWRKIETFDYTGASRYTGYLPKSIILTLECGHQQYRKASQGVPQKAHCRECERAIDERETVHVAHAYR